MLKYYEGTVFNTDADVLVNAVNCFGIMGSGIALEFKLRYPDMFLEYMDMCKRNEYKVGKPCLHIGKDKQILNFPTKNHWKTPSKIEWIEEGLKYFSYNYRKAGIKSIAFPKLGCGNGELKWEEVKPLMEKYLLNLVDIQIIICLDELNQAEGVEKKMTENLNSMPFELLNQKLKINKKQSKAIKKELPIERFWMLNKLPGIGEKTYEKLFKYFYSNCNSESIDNAVSLEQLSLFQCGNEKNIKEKYKREGRIENENNSKRIL